MPDGNRRLPLPRSKAGKGGLTGAIAGLALLAGISYEDAEQTVHDVDQHESGGRQRLHSFRDSVGIWTICGGITHWNDGRAVGPGDTATVDECRVVTVQQINDRTKPLVRGIPQIYQRPNQIRALIDLSFNAGVSGVVNGSIGRNIRAGNWARASVAILPYDKGTYPRPQRGMACVKKQSRPGWACRIPGLTTRRLANKCRFDVGRPDLAGRPVIIDPRCKGLQQ
jgi:GH24 family phage-related lysozyme (muramidase)